ncbi:hypothetical protein H8E77_38090 [bacterium]|nr:hypothetical protein [bacterium]
MPWQRDFFEIDLDKVEMSDLDSNWQWTKSYTREEMEQSIRELQEIQKLCRDYGYTHTDFQQMSDSPDADKRALAETYHKFYDHNTNHDYIKVSWTDDSYEIVNGQHRIFLAKEAGLRHLPAQVSAPDEATLERLRADGERIARRETPQGEERSRVPPWERNHTPSHERDLYRERC